MKDYLQKCGCLSKGFKAQSQNLEKDGILYVGNAADSDANKPSAPSQTGLQRLMPFEDIDNHTARGI